MAKSLETNISQAISDFDEIKAALKRRGMEADGVPTSSYGHMVRLIEAGSPEQVIINDVRYLFASDRRLNDLYRLIPLCKNFPSGEYMFSSSNTLEAVDVSGLDVSEMTDATGMFVGCEKLKTIDLSTWNTPRLTTMYRMFYNCYDLESVITGDLDTHNVTSMAEAFRNCRNLTFVGKLNVGKVTTMSGMFDGCGSLKNVDVSNWDTHELTNTVQMFRSCTSLESIDMTNWDTRKIANMGYMFTHCQNLAEIIGFSATNKAGISIAFPSTTSGTRNYFLKRLTFKTEGLDDLHAIRSNINIQYCSFRRAGMVEMFNTLTDVSNMTHTTKTITITGNPCVTGTLKIDGKGGSGIAVDSYAEYVAEVDAFYGDLDRTGATVSAVEVGGSTWKTFNIADVTEENFNFRLIRFSAYTGSIPESDLLTDEDRAIATLKGWTLVE